MKNHHASTVRIRLGVASGALGCAAILALGIVLASPVAALEDSKAVETEPAKDEVIDRPVRSLRVFLDREPVVEKCSLELVGPVAGLSVEGLHTMGANDLMARVVGPMPDGKYTAKWNATYSDGATESGEWSFVIKRGD
jgi:methionine-rich copper-binding protein CopC